MPPAPDEWDEAAAEHLGDEWDEAAAEPVDVPAPPTISAGRAATLGFAQGGTMGFADEIGGAIGALLPSGKTAQTIADTAAAVTNQPWIHDLVGVPESSVKFGPAAMPSDTDTSEQLRAKADLLEGVASAPTSYELVRNNMRAEAKQAKEQQGGAYMAGDVAGSVLGSVAGNLLVPGGGAIGRGATEGGIAGLGASEADLLKGEYEDAARDTATGAVLGGAGGAAGNLLMKPILSRVPGMARGAQEGLEEAASERALKAAGYIQKDFPRQPAARARLIERGGLLLDEPGVIRPGSSAAAIGERAGEAADEYGGDVIGALLKQADDAGAQFNPATFLKGARDLAAEVAGDPALRPQAMRLSALARGYERKAQELAAQGLPFTFQEANKLKGSLQGAIFNQRGDVKVNHELANRLQRLFTDEIDTQLEGSLGHDAAIAFRDAKMRYGALIGAAEKGPQGANRAAGNNFFGLPDYVAANAAAAAGGGPIAAAATGAASSALRGRADSVLAISLKRLSESDFLRYVAEQSPEHLGDFGPTIMNAIQRGVDGDDKALAATDYVLQQTNPEYRAMKERLAELKEQGQ